MIEYNLDTPMESYLKKQLKYYKLQYWLTHTSFWLVVLAFILLLLSPYYMYNYTPYIFEDALSLVLPPNTTISFDDLNEKEIKQAQKAINNVDLRYLRKQRSITFTKNLSKFYDEEAGGVNINKGEIYVVYTGIEQIDLTTLCHELLHTYIYSGEIEHEIVYDLGNKKVCYVSKV